MIRVDIYGDKIDLADELMEEFHKEAIGAVEAARDVLFRESATQITRRGSNAPAPPGETPATVTGNLLRKMRKIRGTVKGRVARAGVRYAPHAHLVEYGHVMTNGVRVLPRPFIRIAEQNAEPEIEQVLKARLG